MLHIYEENNFENLKEMAVEWNVLVKRGLGDVALTYEWSSTLWEVHLGRKAIKTIILEEDNELRGVMPLYEEHTRKNGLKVVELNPIWNLYSNHGGALLSGEEGVVEAFLEYVNGNYQWDILKLYGCLESEICRKTISWAKNTGRKFSIKANPGSPFLKLDRPLDQILAGKSANFRANIKRKERKLKEAGDLTLDKYTNVGEVEMAIDQICEIEKESWKHKAGTAITSVKRQELFFRGLALRAAEQGWLRIYFLSLDRVPVAHEFALVYEGVYYMMKTSYKESFGNLSPGVVIQWLTIKDAFSMGLREYDFLGASETYKLEWADGVREHNTVWVFNKKWKPEFVFEAGRVKQTLKRLLPL